MKLKSLLLMVLIFATVKNTFAEPEDKVATESVQATPAEPEVKVATESVQAKIAEPIKNSTINKNQFAMVLYTYNGESWEKTIIPIERSAISFITDRKISPAIIWNFSKDGNEFFVQIDDKNLQKYIKIKSKFELAETVAYPENFTSNLNDVFDYEVNYKNCPKSDYSVIIFEKDGKYNSSEYIFNNSNNGWIENIWIHFNKQVILALTLNNKFLGNISYKTSDAKIQGFNPVVCMTNISEEQLLSYFDDFIKQKEKETKKDL